MIAMKNNVDQALLDAMSRNPSNWRGVFYFNRKDPRLVVPKQNPMLGWTFNFASPYAYITLLAIIAIAVAASYLG
jgi:uncharacterized membrane protein